MKIFLIISIIVIVILVTGYFIYDYLRIKPLMLEDIIYVESDRLGVATGVFFEDTILNVQQLGTLNWNIGEVWKDDNQYVDGKERPLVVAVSNQRGPVPSQILTIMTKERTFEVYLPDISGDRGSWAWLYIDSDGSSYWGCQVWKACDSGLKGSEEALKKENMARKAI